MVTDGARREEILETAAALFASSGLRTSLREIADACGIQPGSLYHHFDSKEAIIVELLERYREDLDTIAKDASIDRAGSIAVEDRVVRLGSAIAACAVRHRAALLLTLYQPPTGASDHLVEVASRSSMAIETTMLETLRAGQVAGEIRPEVDVETLADRLCQVLLHVSLGVFRDVRGARDVPAIRCRALLQGIAVDPP